MKNHLFVILSLAGFGLAAGHVAAEDSAKPYKVLDTTQLMGTGGIDYVLADSEDRRVYVPRGTQTFVFDLDSHKQIGAIADIGGHGVAIDHKSHHGFSSSSPVGMFDTKTMQKIKTIEVKGRPDGIMYEPFTKKILIFSHASPSITVIDPKEGEVTGTIDVGGAMEQAQSDGKGMLYIDAEDEKKVAVVDLKAMKLVTKYDLGEKAGEPAGLGLDEKNHLLFAMCAGPDVCVVLNAKDGKILDTLPLGGGTDGGGFNAHTKEAWSSGRNGKLTVIKENSPTSFAVEQNVETKQGCKTSSLDEKKDIIVTVCVERTAPPAGATPAPAEGGARRGRGGPGMLDVLYIGR